MRVLIIDDEELICRIVGMWVKECGCAFISVTTGKEAIEIADRVEFDAVICDHTLTDANGFAVLKQLKIPRKAMMSGEDYETLALSKGYKFMLKPNIEEDVKEFVSGKY